MTKKRDQISEEYKWDLKTIYANEEEWEKDFQFIMDSIEEYKKYKDTLMDSAFNLYNFMKFDEKISRIIDKLYSYAHMSSDVDTSDSKYQSLEGRAYELYSKVSSASSFFTPTLLKSDYSKIEQYMEEEPELKKSELQFKKAFRYKPYTLSDKEEKILIALGGVVTFSKKTFSYLKNSDIKFGQIKNENGELVDINESKYAIFRESSDKEVRRESFEKIFGTYGSYKNTISSTLYGYINGIVKCNMLRNYNSSIEASLYNDEVDVSVYDKLIETVHNNLDKLFDYYDVKKQILGLDEMHLYDTYAKVMGNSTKKYSFEEAKELVLKATSIFGSKYTKILEKAFNERWIDIYPNENKRGGAYSGGCYDTNPFVLLNYEGLLNDVSTVAHELGHSVHSYLTRTSNPVQTGDYEIFVAEVASTVNEILLARYMLNNSDDKKEKLVILNNLLDLFKATVYRQTMFAEFEKFMYEKVEQGEILTSDLLCNAYLELNKKYFGDNIIVDDLIKNEWMRIPHFYMNFYVYKYATGLSCASHIVENILSGKEGSVENYLNFLSSGCKKPPMELLKDTGCDLNSSEVVESALNMFSNLLDEFVQTYNEVEGCAEDGQKRLLRGSWRK